MISGDLSEKWVTISVRNSEFGSFSYRYDDVLGVPEELLVVATLANDHQLTVQTAASNLDLNSTGIEWTDLVLRSFAGLKAAVIRHLCSDRLVEHSSLNWLHHKLFTVDTVEDSEGRDICNDLDSRSVAFVSIDEIEIAMARDTRSRSKGEIDGVLGIENEDSRIEEAVNAAYAALVWHYRLPSKDALIEGNDMGKYHEFYIKAKSVEQELEKYASVDVMLEAAVAALLERSCMLLCIEPRKNPDADELLNFMLFGPDRKDFEKVLTDRCAQTWRITAGLKIFCTMFESSASRQEKNAILAGMVSAIKHIVSSSWKFEFTLIDPNAVESLLLIWRQINDMLHNELALLVVDARGDEYSVTTYALLCLQAMSFHLDDNCIRRLSRQNFQDTLAKLLNSGDHRIRSASVCMIDAIISELLQSRRDESARILESLTTILISKLRYATTPSSIPPLEIGDKGDCEVILSKRVTISSLEDCYILRMNTHGAFSLAFWLWLPNDSVSGNILVMEGELSLQRSLLSLGIQDGVFVFSLASTKVTTVISATSEKWHYTTLDVDELAGTISLTVDGLSSSASITAPKSGMYSRLYVGHSEASMYLGRSVHCSIADLVLRSRPDSSPSLSQSSKAFVINRFERCIVRLSCDKPCPKDLSFGVSPKLYSGIDSSFVFGQSADTIGIHYSSALASFVMRNGNVIAGPEDAVQSFPYFGGGFFIELDFRSCGNLFLTAQEKGRHEIYTIEYTSSRSSFRGMMIGIASEDLASIRYEARDELDKSISWDMGLARYGYPAAFSPESSTAPTDVIASLGCLSKLPVYRMSREQKSAARTELSTLCSNSSSVLVRLSAARYVAQLEAAAWSE